MAGQLSTGEAEVAVQILRDDPDACDMLLNPQCGDGGSRRIPLGLWESILGKPTSKTALRNDFLLIYKTRDGTLSVRANGCLPEINGHVYSKDMLENPWIQIFEIEISLSLDPNQPIERANVKQRVLVAKKAFEKAHACPREKMAQRHAEEAKHAGMEQAQRAKEEEERQHSQLVVAEEAVKVQAEKLLACFGAKPAFVFAQDFDLSTPTVEYVGATARLADALRNVTTKSDWSDLQALLKTHDKFPDLAKYDAIQKRFTELMELEYDTFFRILVRTNRDLSGATRIFYTDSTLYEWHDWERHPDGSAWIFAWHPLMKEGFVVPAKKFDTGDYWGAKHRIDEQVATAAKRHELGEAVPDEKEVKRRAVKEVYEQLKAKCLGTVVSRRD